MKYLVLNMLGIMFGGYFSEYISRFTTKRETDAMLYGANIIILLIGVQGAIETNNTLLVLLSIVIGGFIGTRLDIDGKFQSVGNLAKMNKNSNSAAREGIVIMFMMQAIGSMAILGPLDVGLKGDGSLLILKTVIDTTTSIIYGTKYGRSIAWVGPLVFIYQGLIFLFAKLISPILNPIVVNEISAIGSVLIFMLGLNLLEIKESKVANFLPAILGPIVLFFFESIF
ncbi:MAG: DUF554 domain-containing protein [Tissierellia bacterium]|nr:DUF554 domain-containing protein [Tissierellia bacterium]